MMVLAGAIATLTGAAGLYLSYYASTAAGASIAAVMVVVFLAAAVIRRLRDVAPEPVGG